MAPLESLPGGEGSMRLAHRDDESTCELLRKRYGETSQVYKEKLA
jgi:hypothetical protein